MHVHAFRQEKALMRKVRSTKKITGQTNDVKIDHFSAQCVFFPFDAEQAVQTTQMLVKRSIGETKQSCAHGKEQCHYHL